MSIIERIAEGRRLVDGSRPSPWFNDNGEIMDGEDRAILYGNACGEAFANDADADFIVWARNNLPELLNALVKAERRAEHHEDNRRIAEDAHRDAVARARKAEETIERIQELAAEWQAAPLVGSSSEEQWEFDTERRCGRELRDELEAS